MTQLLNGMLEKGMQEQHDEQEQFAAYKQFCDDTTESASNKMCLDYVFFFH